MFMFVTSMFRVASATCSNGVVIVQLGDNTSTIRFIPVDVAELGSGVAAIAMRGVRFYFMLFLPFVWLVRMRATSGSECPSFFLTRIGVVQCFLSIYFTSARIF
jgi:hypothetical protein